MTASIFTDWEKGHVMLSEMEFQAIFSGVVNLMINTILETTAYSLKNRAIILK